MDLYREELRSVARSIASPGKGILAADESIPTIGRRFDKIKVENTVETRRKYRGIFPADPVGRADLGPPHSHDHIAN